MNGYGDDTNSSPCCYFHPREKVIGICPLCLNERLLVLASKQGHSSSNSSSSAARRGKVSAGNKKRPNNISNLPSIFALGSLLNRFEFLHWKPDISHRHDARSSSQEDSFISMKFEDTGAASWEKQGAVSKVSLRHCSRPWKITNKSINTATSCNSTMVTNKQPMIQNNKSVIEHSKQRGATLRWRKKIGHLLQLVKWKAANKGGNVDGVKVRNKGWIRTLTLTKRPPRSSSSKGI